MAKFTVEVDIETKSFKVMSDGNEISPSDFSIGCYTDYEDKKHYYVSASVKDGNTLYSKSFSWSTGEDTDSSISDRNVAKELGRQFESIMLSDTIKKTWSAKHKSKEMMMKEKEMEKKKKEMMKDKK